jgi:hypothetical protein
VSTPLNPRVNVRHRIFVPHRSTGRELFVFPPVESAPKKKSSAQKCINPNAYTRRLRIRLWPIKAQDFLLKTFTPRLSVGVFRSNASQATGSRFGLIFFAKVMT